MSTADADPSLPSFETIVAAITATGAPFEMDTIEIGGRDVRVFKNAPANLRDMFALVRGHGDGTALVYEDERQTYNELLDDAAAIATLLVETHGVEPGDRVAIAMRNYPEWISSFIAVTSIGAVAVALNGWWLTDEMRYGLEDSGSSVLIADRERIDRVLPLLDDLDLDIIAVRCDGADGIAAVDLPARATHLREAITVGAPMPAREISPDADATILYTSGTTGFPKGAVSTHRAVVQALFGFASRSTIATMQTLPLGTEPPAPAHPPALILCVPLFHVTGLVPVMMGSLLGGSKLVIMYKWDPARALELIERERITTFVGVPTMSWDLLESPDFDTRDTSSLASVGGGGAPAPPRLVQRIEDNFSNARPGIGYGMTETNALGPQNSGDDYVTRPDSTGRAAPIIDLKVIDELGNDLGPDEIGEICFGGPTLIRGYWNKPEATAETLVDGWLRSGDIGRIDPDGYVYVSDRAKDLVIRAGENISCPEVEAAIYEHPDVYEAAVFGVPHESLGEELAVYVLPKEGTGLDAAAIQEHVGARLAKFKIPTRVYLATEQLPRNASGKILKRQLRDEVVEAENLG